jgi:hypothetical protein|tara:strand:- start:625 stop:990 length:366 start_codon:yes stop_codon:yes gene_type:complete
MGTRSAIGYVQPCGSVRAVYCHWDGYPSHQLPILQEHYNSLDKVKALIKPGSMSSLRTEHTWLNNEKRAPQPLYHHERDDLEVKPLTSNEPKSVWFDGHDCEYMYIFDGKKWNTHAKNPPV